MTLAKRNKRSGNVFEECEGELAGISEDLTKFLTFDRDAAQRFAQLSKRIFDSSQIQDIPDDSSPVDLTELIIDGFDDEQIWQELELRNQPLLESAISDFASVSSNPRLNFAVAFEESHDPHLDEDSEDEGSGVDEPIFVPSSGEEEEEEERTEQESQRKPTKKRGVAEDAFFKLASLEEFLDVEDLKEERRLRKQRKGDADTDDDEEDDDESIDLFADIADEGCDAAYEDFFDEIEDAEKDPTDDDSAPRSRSQRKSVRFEDEVESPEPGSPDPNGADYDFRDAEGGDMEEDITEAATKTTKDLFKDSDDEDITGTSFEKNQKKLLQKIRTIEDNRLAEKTWQMRGEISSKSRPENSLMEEHLDFDHQTRQAPQITQTLTERLEGWITQRIKDRAWDDVVRKVKPKEEVFEFRRRLTLDQEKSKVGLAEVYEQEFLKLKDGEVEQTNPEHDQIRKAITQLFTQLDMLSNYHFMPKPLKADLKIVKNLPTILVEEVAPAAVADDTLLAPEEIKRKSKRDIMAKAERDNTDRHRERRLKKVHQRKKQEFLREKEQLLAERDPKLKGRLDRKTARESLAKTANTKVLKTPKERDGSLKSSTKFFERLQTQVTNQLSTKKDLLKKRGEKKVRIGTLKL